LNDRWLGEEGAEHQLEVGVEDSQEEVRR
jgi:hypothetical protein